MPFYIMLLSVGVFLAQKNDADTQKKIHVADKTLKTYDVSPQENAPQKAILWNFLDQTAKENTPWGLPRGAGITEVHGPW